MKKVYLISILLFVLGACSNVDQQLDATDGAPEPQKMTELAPKAPHLVGKVANSVECVHIQDSAIATYTDCAPPEINARARQVQCDDILPDFVGLYEECVDPKVAAFRFHPFTLSSLSSGEFETDGFISGSTLSVDQRGVRTVSNTVGDKTISISSNMDISTHPLMNR